MITQFKFKLFANDPKFRNIPASNKNAQQIAIQKVYAGQKQLHRKNVIMDSIAKKSNPNLTKPNMEIDFLQSRVHSFQMMIANDIQKIFQEVQLIKQTYQQRKSIQYIINARLKEIAKKIQKVDNSISLKDEQQLIIVQSAVSDIQNLFQQNLRLKNENSQIAVRIQKRKAALTKKSKGFSGPKHQKR